MEKSATFDQAPSGAAQPQESPATVSPPKVDTGDEPHSNNSGASMFEALKAQRGVGFTKVKTKAKARVADCLSMEVQSVKFD